MEFSVWFHLWSVLKFATCTDQPVDNITTGDQCLRNNAPAYQWACIRELAKENPDFAVENAGKFTCTGTEVP
jgi:hypothetical protein